MAYLWSPVYKWVIEIPLHPLNNRVFLVMGRLKVTDVFLATLSKPFLSGVDYINSSQVSILGGSSHLVGG